MALRRWELWAYRPLEIRPGGLDLALRDCGLLVPNARRVVLNFHETPARRSVALAPLHEFGSLNRPVLVAPEEVPYVARARGVMGPAARNVLQHHPEPLRGPVR